ncbi:heme anaerobic degradation radical SAM methyltransferase ChuW/HutW [Pasteurellaceae bacterium HPA106]|uniref:heme anaerobic degradation radical SAM methyltransferase ChuW/HutW n=1 Tax=Spirabiliibacterium pneumoniae TaxID=221400 RepID=UPI001AACEDC9|nr:heme anaerobic degradation radical SAM methyltransferase ChuW/HutW [Spirabiliibacterium pneumoniae]MBE2895788.1 heme anaerobic degradation radical SAM methyltransferase ChuW/HutW [Spirabiliibacterium pneumoniae]
MINTLHWRAQQAAPHAFPERQALMPIWGGEAVAHAQWQTLWQQAIVHAIDGDVLAYIHIPFCASHCIFCGFYRNRWQDDQSAVYTDRVIAQLQFEAAQRHDHGQIRAVYFGGGTPSALHTHDLVRLIRACYDYLPLSDDCEFTIEGRISHFEVEKAQACIDAGANRISIGVQTFHSPLRKRLGRKHSGEQAVDYLHALSELNAVVVADLIFGLPSQNDEIWARDIAIAAQLPIAGLDIYAFNNYAHLPINRLIEHGTLPPPASFAQQSVHYAYAVETLQEHGWQQVSNNHFAYPNRGERNRYNTLVKSNLPCLAFGAGAGGNVGQYRYQVQSDLTAYLNSPVERAPLSYLSRHGVHKNLLGKVQHSLELGYLDARLFADNPPAQALLATWQQQGLLTRDGDQITLNTSGRYWSPTLIRKLMLTLPERSKDNAVKQPLSETQKTALCDNLKANPGQILEMLAAMNQCSLEAVIACLPAEMVLKTDGERFVEIMQAIASWDEEVTFIVHTPDAIAEVTDKLPMGKIARGFYNFDQRAQGALHGHLRYENCAAIYLLDRPFMGKRTVALTFINRQGEAMFKIFAGRDEAGEIKAHQIEAMRTLMQGA